VPAYDPVAILNKTQPLKPATLDVATDVYGTDVDGEVAVRQAALPDNFIPKRVISDQGAADFVRGMAEASFFSENPTPALAYASIAPSLHDLTAPGDSPAGIAENVTVVPKSITAMQEGPGRSERFLTVREIGPLADTLVRNGFTRTQVSMVEG